MALLEVRNLRTTFTTSDGPVVAVDGISFTVEPGKVLGIVGESGSGKSVTSLSLMRLLPKSATVEGTVLFQGKNLLDMPSEDLRRIRGNEIAMVFQEPMTSLNPVYSIGWQLQEAVLLHNDVKSSAAQAHAVEMLAAVGIPSPRERMSSYPHEFSGGMRQRVMIAMALCNNPALLIADEPTTALDVTTQAQILSLIRRLRQDFNSAVILITHDLGVIADACDDVLVMYGGRVAEQGSVERIFEAPQHPYTWGLLGSLPSRAVHGERLIAIPGAPPNLLFPPPGCRFHPRCADAMDICLSDPAPILRQSGSAAASHLDACHLSADVKTLRAGSLLTTVPEETR